MEQPKSIKFISRILISFGVLFVNMFVFSAIAVALCKQFYNVDITQLLSLKEVSKVSLDQTHALRLYQAVVSVGSFILTSIVLAYAFKQNPIEYLGLYQFPKAKYLISIPILIIIASPALTWMLELNSNLKLPSVLNDFETRLKALETANNNLYQAMLQMPSPSDLFVNIAVMALIPALGEEFFCRGVLLNVLYDYNGKFMKSVIIVALVFTILHLQVFKFLPMMTLAIILGLYINFTKGLWASILFHFLNNTISVLASYFEQRGIKNIFFDNDAQLPLWAIISSFVLSGILIYTLIKTSKNNTAATDE